MLNQRQFGGNVVQKRPSRVQCGIFLCLSLFHILWPNFSALASESEAHLFTCHLGRELSYEFYIADLSPFSLAEGPYLFQERFFSGTTYLNHGDDEYETSYEFQEHFLTISLKTVEGRLQVAKVPIEDLRAWFSSRKGYLNKNVPQPSHFMVLFEDGNTFKCS